MAKVNKVELVNDNVYEVTLNAVIDGFIAGQYLMFELPSGEMVPYSIGSAPHELPEIKLYILVASEDSLAGKVIEYLNSNEQVLLKIPGGDCHIENALIKESTKEILLIAGGTGFAQMKSMYDGLIAKNTKVKVTLYWGLRVDKDLFLPNWLSARSNINVVVNEASTDWKGHTGWLYDKIIADHDFKDTVAYLSGSPSMVYGTLDQLEAAGLSKEASYSDVFAYAPRSA